MNLESVERTSLSHSLSGGPDANRDNWKAVKTKVKEGDCNNPFDGGGERAFVRHGRGLREKYMPVTPVARPRRPRRASCAARDFAGRIQRERLWNQRRISLSLSPREGLKTFAMPPSGGRGGSGVRVQSGLGVEELRGEETEPLFRLSEFSRARPRRKMDSALTSRRRRMEANLGGEEEKKTESREAGRGRKLPPKGSFAD